MQSVRINGQQTLQMLTVPPEKSTVMHDGKIYLVANVIWNLDDRVVDLELREHETELPPKTQEAISTKRGRPRGSGTKKA